MPHVTRNTNMSFFPANLLNDTKVGCCIHLVAATWRHGQYGIGRRGKIIAKLYLPIMCPLDWSGQEYWVPLGKLVRCKMGRRGDEL